MTHSIGKVNEETTPKVRVTQAEYLKLANEIIESNLSDDEKMTKLLALAAKIEIYENKTGQLRHPF